jgi:hypothetical protein
VSKQNNSGNGRAAQASQAGAAQTSAPAEHNAAPNPGEEQFRRETAEAMENDLMAETALVPDSVAVKLPPSKAVPKIEAGEAYPGQREAQAQGTAPVPGTTQILSLLQAGKIDVAEAERLMCALKNVAPSAPPDLPYIGGSDGPATRQEILAAVQQVYGADIASRTRDKKEMMEVMGAMVERIVLKLREPSEEEKLALERKKRDRNRTIKEQLEMIRQKHEFEKMCPHERATSDGKSHTCISALHNYVDNQLRGTCGLCHTIIGPGDDGFRQVIMQHNLAMHN